MKRDSSSDSDNTKRARWIGKGALGSYLDILKEDISSQPEWARPLEIKRVFGVGRSRLYELIKSGQIKSVSLRKRGAARGIRLISCDSMRSFLEGLASKEAK